MYFVSDLFTPYTRGFFSPFLHSTCSLSVSYAYVGLEGGSPIFKQSNVLLLMIMKGIIQDFYLLWSMYSNMFFNFINICLIRVLSPILTESRLISFPRGYLDVSVLLVSKYCGLPLWGFVPIRMMSQIQRFAS